MKKVFRVIIAVFFAATEYFEEKKNLYLKRKNYSKQLQDKEIKIKKFQKEYTNLRRKRIKFETDPIFYTGLVFFIISVLIMQPFFQFYILMSLICFILGKYIYKRIKSMNIYEIKGKLRKINNEIIEINEVEIFISRNWLESVEEGEMVVAEIEKSPIDSNIFIVLKIMSYSDTNERNYNLLNIFSHKVLMCFIFTMSLLYNYYLTGYRNYKSKNITKITNYKTFSNHKFSKNENIFLKNMSYYLSKDSKNIYIGDKNLLNDRYLEEKISEIKKIDQETNEIYKFKEIILLSSFTSKTLNLSDYGDDFSYVYSKYKNEFINPKKDTYGEIFSRIDKKIEENDKYINKIINKVINKVILEKTNKKIILNNFLYENDVFVKYIHNDENLYDNLHKILYGTYLDKIFLKVKSVKKEKNLTKLSFEVQSYTPTIEKGEKYENLIYIYGLIVILFLLSIIKDIFKQIISKKSNFTNLKESEKKIRKFNKIEKIEFEKKLERKKFQFKGTKIFYVELVFLLLFVLLEKPDFQFYLILFIIFSLIFVNVLKRIQEKSIYEITGKLEKGDKNNAFINKIPVSIYEEWMKKYENDDIVFAELKAIKGLNKFRILKLIPYSKKKQIKKIDLSFLKPQLIILCLITIFFLFDYYFTGYIYYKSCKSKKILKISNYKELINHKFTKNEKLKLKNINYYLSRDGKNIYFIDKKIPKENKINRKIYEINYNIQKIEIYKNLYKKNEKELNNLLNLDYSYKDYKNIYDNFKRRFIDIGNGNLNYNLNKYINKMNKKIDKLVLENSKKINKKIIVNNFLDFPIRYNAKIKLIKPFKLEEVVYGDSLNETFLNIKSVKVSGSNINLKVKVLEYETAEKYKRTIILYEIIILLFILFILYEIYRANVIFDRSLQNKFGRIKY